MGLTPQEMDSAIIRNLRDKTGNSLEGWIEILETNTLSEKKEIIKFLKEDKGLGHFQAQTVYKHFKIQQND